MGKTAKLIITLGTNPDVFHIGRYFVDIRDTTNGRNRQLTTRVLDAGPLRKFIDDFKAEAVKHGVTVTVINDTLDLAL